MAPLRALGPLVTAAGLLVLSAHSLVRAFAPNPAAPKGASVVTPPRALGRTLSSRSASGVGSAGSDAAQGPLCGAIAAGVALGGLAAARAAAGRRRSEPALQRRAFFSGEGSSFLGTPTATSQAVSYGMVTCEAPADDYSRRQGVGGMGMKAQVWWIQNNGMDGKRGHIFDWKRRESRRRGEELFRHDVDNFELTQNNLIAAPGAKKKKIRRGRGKYGSHGRTCGYGNGGIKKRGRRHMNPWYEGGHVPLARRLPKLSKEQLDSMKLDPYTPIKLSILNKCDDGDEVDYMDLFSRGFPVKAIRHSADRRFYKFKVKGKDKDEFTVKNLTVYAHAFEPPAREKIEANGGRCVRLHDRANIPWDEGAISTLTMTPYDESEAPTEEDTSTEEAPTEE